MRSLALRSIVAALLSAPSAACGEKESPARSVNEVFHDPEGGWFHVRWTPPAPGPTDPADDRKRREYEAVAPVDGVYTLQFASGLPDAAQKPDASIVKVFPTFSEPRIDSSQPSPPLALLVRKDDSRSVARVALAVRAGEVVTIRAETPPDIPRYDADGNQSLAVDLFLGANKASKSDSVTRTRRNAPPSGNAVWTISGAELAHGPQTFHRVRDGHPVTLYACVVHDPKEGPEIPSQSLTLRLRFLPQPVADDHPADDD